MRRRDLAIDLTTVLWRRGKLSLILEPRDLWIGAYIAPHAIYVALVPLLVLKWKRTPK